MDNEKMPVEIKCALSVLVGIPTLMLILFIMD